MNLDSLYGAMKDAGKSPTTIANHRAIISAALHQALRWGGFARKSPTWRNHHGSLRNGSKRRPWCGVRDVVEPLSDKTLPDRAIATVMGRLFQPGPILTRIRMGRTVRLSDICPPYASSPPACLGQASPGLIEPTMNAACAKLGFVSRERRRLLLVRAGGRLSADEPHLDTGYFVLTELQIARSDAVVLSSCGLTSDERANPLCRYRGLSLGEHSRLRCPHTRHISHGENSRERRLEAEGVYGNPSVDRHSGLSDHGWDPVGRDAQEQVKRHCGTISEAGHFGRRIEFADQLSESLPLWKTCRFGASPPSDRVLTQGCSHHALSTSESGSSNVGGFRPVSRHSEETIL